MATVARGIKVAGILAVVGLGLAAVVDWVAREEPRAPALPPGLAPPRVTPVTDAALGAEYRRAMAAGAESKYRAGETLADYYQGLPDDERLADLLEHLLDGGLGHLVASDRGGQLPFLIEALDGEVGRPAAREYARAMEKLSGHVARDGTVDAEGRRLAGELDRVLRPIRARLDEEVSLYFYPLSGQ